MAARIGLVLGAGGVTGGAFHAGVLAALHEATGWDARDAELVVGTSAGSLTAASLRAGLSPDDLLARNEGRPLSPAGARILRAAAPPAWTDLRPRTAASGGRRGPQAAGMLAELARRPWRARPGTVAAALLPRGRLPIADLTTAFDPVFGGRWPRHALWVCAVRLTDGGRVVFGRDAKAPVPRAVAASCAIPGFFEPVEIDGVDHVDGGVHSPTNLDVVAGLGLDLVIVSSPMSLSGRGLFPTADVPLRRACRAYLDREALAVRRRGTHVIAFQPTLEDARVMGANAMDPRRREATAGQVRESTLRRLARADTRRRLAPLTALTA
ncbi:MAG TPA: patatin-like phospholipase family protein [Acidimicrobiales bacterium]|nr:patatin-like phospholipase family protein [Acidimicrobiales bacterium]